MNSEYKPAEIEPKWQQYWQDKKAHQTGTPSEAKPKKYLLDMFPYPSGDGLHVGHVEGYSASDVLARYYRARGFSVLHPIGFDAFGLPAENYAIKQGVPPAESTSQNIKNFTRQIKSLGLSYDWSREINTSDPAYYRWTQWLFLQLFKQGLAYQKEALVNWCEKDQTVLANEQVINGKCERCGELVSQKSMKQWFFKITAYAEQLLNDLDGLDWPEAIVHSQKNWLGKSTGANIEFAVKEQSDKIEVFTTRPDTIFGATYLVLSPEHPLVAKIVDAANRAEVEAYQQQAAAKSELERTFLQKEKTGVFTGAYAVNPFNQAEIPIWVADYVIASYGTGAIMAVPAHDERDFEFAKKYDLPIKMVVTGGDLPYCDFGTLTDSSDYTGLKSEEAIAKMGQWLAEQKLGELATTYRLRDWLISRQRYWGAPIPIIHCKKCGAQPVPEDELPVTLPNDVDFRPHGHSPLADSQTFLQAKCPKCGGEAQRETDTMDTFVCSSWYYLRYVSPTDETQAWDQEEVKKWLPVDLYIGGAEHAVLHLLYARFFTKFLADQKLLAFREPFTALRNVGMILGPDHRKMSKSLGNVINPDEVVEQYGADVLRLHELFMGPFSDEKPWNTESIKGVVRFLDNVWQLLWRNGEADNSGWPPALAKVTNDTDKLLFNTAISALMGFTTAHKNKGLSSKVKQEFLVALFPYAPHIASELWSRLKFTGELWEQSWPEVKEESLTVKSVTVVVQVNGKVRSSLEVAPNSNEEDVKQQAAALEKIASYLVGKQVKNTIYVPNKIVNFVVTDV